ncbi:MAG: hypothetical protein ACFCUU_00290 [Cyclobacteriaceae bacterium]
MKILYFSFIITFFYLSFFLSYHPVLAQKSDILDNKEIIDMVEKGLPNSIIIKKIESSLNNFDLSTDALVQLSATNIPEDIIAAMMESGHNKIDDNYELVKKFDQPGIYFLLEDDSDVKYLAPTVIDKVKEGSFGSHMAGALTAAAKKKVKAIISGTTANMQTDSKPVFFFYFGNPDDVAVNNQPQYNQNDPVAMIHALQNMGTGEKVRFSGIQSPNEIRLVKPDVDKKERSFVASSSSGMVRETGIDSNYVVQFKNDRIAPGLYKVYCENPLQSGEYLFVYAGSSLYSGQYIYDFTVK